MNDREKAKEADLGLFFKVALFQETSPALASLIVNFYHDKMIINVMLFSKTIPTSKGDACLKKLTNNTTALFENIEKIFLVIFKSFCFLLFLKIIK